MNSMPTIAAGTLGGAPTGTWRIDPAHSSVSFSVRHLMSKVRGRFRDVEGRIGIRPDLADCSVSASIAVTSVDTGTPQRDDDLRSDRFFRAGEHPKMTFESTAVDAGTDGTGTVVGDLTIRGITRQVRLEAEFLGLDATGLQGEPRIGFAARTTIRRSDFHVGERSAEGSKVVVGDTVAVELDVEAHLEKADPEGATS
jgi:polyisoprenoid-binding protein YceI